MKRENYITDARGSYQSRVNRRLSRMHETRVTEDHDRHLHVEWLCSVTDVPRGIYRAGTTTPILWYRYRTLIGT